MSLRTAVVAVVVAACAHDGAAPVVPVGPAVKYKDVATDTLTDDIAAGHVTLVDFWADWCGACVTVAGHIAVAIANDDRIVVRRVDIGDGTSSLAREHQVSALPHWEVYDKHQRLRYRLLGSEVLRAPRLAAELLGEP